jgi:DNA polymerase III sliding clamp (beta) subunit (PCNA family)
MTSLTLTRGTIRALLTIAPTVDVRYYMIGARVKTDARGTIVESTDGHAMIRVRVSPVPAPITSTIIPRALLEGAAGKGKKTLLDAVQVDIQSDGTITLTEPDGTVRTGKAIDGTFPDTDRVTPLPAVTPIEPAQFNPTLLARVHTALQLLGADEVDIQVRQHGMKPTLVTALAVPDALAVIMPWRQSDATLPSWAALTETGGAR